MRIRSIVTAAFVVFVVCGSALCRADNLYTFEEPQFSAGELTPIAPTAPNSGDPSFLTTFAATGDPGGLEIADGFPSPLFSGQFLVTNNGGVTTLTFNQPVYALSVDFGLDAMSNDPVAYFELVTSSGTFDQINTAPGGPFAGGILSFSSGIPFTSATLDGFADPGDETFYAIDNLDLSTSPVPEPSYLPLLGAALAGLLVLSQRSKLPAA